MLRGLEPAGALAGIDSGSDVFTSFAELTRMLSSSRFFCLPAASLRERSSEPSVSEHGRDISWEE